jgi:hypothetical protein
VLEAVVIRKPRLLRGLGVRLVLQQGKQFRDAIGLLE